LTGSAVAADDVATFADEVDRTIRPRRFQRRGGAFVPPRSPSFAVVVLVVAAVAFEARPGVPGELLTRLVT